MSSPSDEHHRRLLRLLLFEDENKHQDDGTSFNHPVSSIEYRQPIDGIVNRAAILILLRWDDNICYTLLTKRSDSLRRHPGEIAFPGGVRDVDDLSPIHTALREAYEEVGLPMSYVRVVGNLRPFRTRFHLALYPVLAVLRDDVDFTPKANSDEVSACFWLPLNRFLSSIGHSRAEIEVNGLPVTTHIFEDDTTSATIWGLTAFAAIITAMLVHERKPEFALIGEDVHDHDLSWRQLGNVVLKAALADFRSKDQVSKL